MIYVPKECVPALDGVLAHSFLATPTPHPHARSLARAHTRTLMSKLIKPLDNEIALITVTLLSPYLGLAGITTPEDLLQAHCKHAEPRDSGYYQDFTLGREILAWQGASANANLHPKRAWRRHPSENSIAMHSVPLNCKISLAKEAAP